VSGTRSTEPIDVPAFGRELGVESNAAHAWAIPSHSQAIKIANSLPKFG
jgi:hypothetical protein